MPGDPSICLSEPSKPVSRFTTEASSTLSRAELTPLLASRSRKPRYWCTPYHLELRLRWLSRKESKPWKQKCRSDRIGCEDMSLDACRRIPGNSGFRKRVHRVSLVLWNSVYFVSWTSGRHSKRKRNPRRFRVLATLPGLQSTVQCETSEKCKTMGLWRS